MRVRSTQRPPTREDIKRIIQQGASAEDKVRLRRFLRRLRQACLLDAQDQPLPARLRLTQQYKNDGLVLFLGAGVSVDSGIPNWPKLVDAVLEKSGLAPGEIDDVKKALPSYIAQFELADRRLGHAGFIRAVYECLYEKMACKPLLENIPLKYEAQVGWGGWGGVFKALQANKTLEAVGNLLITDDEIKPRRNPQIHAVLTFNADTLLELFCQAKTNGKRPITRVDRASVGDHPNQVPIYHLHGTLDARGENVFKSAPTSLPPGELQELTDDLLPDLVFRESEYYETIANPTSFVNHTPQSFLRRLNALFIGTSLDDLNMRRWLHDSFSERVRHRTKYLREFYWRQYAAAEDEARVESLRHFWLRPETEKDKQGKTWVVPKEHAESVMSNLGVQVVWCANYGDVQRCIAEVQRDGYDPEFCNRVAQYPT
jgi:SIR2-like domain